MQHEGQNKGQPTDGRGKHCQGNACAGRDIRWCASSKQVLPHQAGARVARTVNKNSPVILGIVWLGQVALQLN